jgi:hypothetical protein
MRKRRKGFSFTIFLLFSVPFFLLCVCFDCPYISSNYLRLSPFIWVCNLSRIINYDQKEALIIHLVNILSWWCILSLRQRLATCYLGLQNLLYIKKKACKYGVKNARGEGTPFNRGGFVPFYSIGTPFRGPDLRSWALDIGKYIEIRSEKKESWGQKQLTLPFLLAIDAPSILPYLI